MVSSAVHDLWISGGDLDDPGVNVADCLPRRQRDPHDPGDDNHDA